MAGLDGTVKTPFGTVSKKTAVIVGGGVVLLGAIVWYRQKQAGSSSDSGTQDAPINPATGYPYGSEEDAAALAAQAAYVAPTDASGGSNYPPSNAGYATNAQWVQGVVQYMIGNGLVEDSTKLSTALGRYITGAYATDTDVALIQQAIAVQGFPPVAGTNGYPPSINRTPSTTPTLGKITGRKSTPSRTSISTSFKGATGAVRYQVTLDGKLWNEISGSPFTIGGLKPDTRHTIGIRAVGSDGKLGEISSVVVRTLK